MTTIILNDELADQVVAKSHHRNAQEAVIKILSDYLQQQEPNIMELLAMPEVADIDFEPPRLNAPLCHSADLS